MPTSKIPLLLGLLAVLSGGTPAMAAPAERPIEAFVSPGHIFPVEGTTFFSRGANPSPESYRPLLVYDKPAGRAIGEVRLSNPHCVSESPPAGCEQGLEWRLHLASGKSVALATAEYSYGTDGLVTYSKSMTAAGALWSLIEYRGGTFWVKTAKEDVAVYEELASYVEDFEQWCTAPGRCAKPDAALQQEFSRLKSGEINIMGCDQGYVITGVVTYVGQRYYKLERPGLDPSSARTILPETGFTPVRNRAGRHTGYFSARGC